MISMKRTFTLFNLHEMYLHPLLSPWNVPSSSLISMKRTYYDLHETFIPPYDLQET